MTKIGEFKQFTRKWIGNIREPRRPEIELADTIWGRIESFIAPLVLVWPYVGLVFNPIWAQVGKVNSDWVALLVWPLCCMGMLIATLVGFLLTSLCIRIGDYIIRGDKSDSFEDWLDPVAEFIASAVTRPISWAIAIWGNTAKMVRFRRECKAYLNSKVKAESVWSDLHRPDAEDLFAGIDDTTMLEGLLRK